MEEHGLVSREIFAEVPARVEYSATSLGLSLEPILLALCQWGQHHADELNETHRLADCIIRPRQARHAHMAWIESTGRVADIGCP